MTRPIRIPTLVIGVAGIAAITMVALLFRGDEAILEAADCRLVTLVDETTGDTLVGIEDIAVDTGAGVASLSAQDRWGLEAAVDDGAAHLPQGGIYRLSAVPAEAGDDAIGVTNLAAAFSGQADFHPHGIGLLRQGLEGPLLAVVNRRYLPGPDDGATAWIPATAVENSVPRKPQGNAR